MPKPTVVLICTIALLVPCFVGCKYIDKLTGKSTPVEKKSCVEDLEAVKGLELNFEGDLPTRISATLAGTVHLREFTKKLDKDVADACAAIARDLGESGIKANDGLDPGERAKDVCERTAKLIKQKREEGGVVLLLYTHAPRCTVGLDDFRSCVQQCDSGLSPEASGVQCDSESAGGRCEAKCGGECIEMFTEECNGVCHGACRGGCSDEFYGKCGGRCIGSCDGQSISGKCEGTCDGKCSSDADGSCQGPCKGKCSGACVSEKKKAVCPGTCVGTCSEDFRAERCAFATGPAEMVPACGAMCDAAGVGKANCMAAYADVVVYNESKEGAAEKIKSALQRRLEILLSADEGLKENADRAHQGILTAFEGIDETLAGNSKAKKEVGACLKDAAAVRDDAAKGLELLREGVTAIVVAIKT